MPRWFIYATIAILVIGIASTVFVVRRCGWQGLLYGSGAVIVATMECER